jgi:hypothetical protein
MAHSFGVVDAVPVKTDEGGESHRTRHGTGRAVVSQVASGDPGHIEVRA